MIDYTTPPPASLRTYGAPESRMGVNSNPKDHVRAVDLEVVDQWLDAGEQSIRSLLSKGGSVERVAVLTGSKTMIDSLKRDIRGARFQAAPSALPEMTVTAPTLDFMTLLDGEKVHDYLARVKDEASQRNLPDVVGFVQSMEFFLQQGEFLPTQPKPTKKYVVPVRDGNMKIDEALNSIVNPSAADKYRAIVAALAAGPFTDDELRTELRDRAHGMVSGTVTAYRGDLARAGWVRYTGEHRRGESGSSMKVWELAP